MNTITIKDDATLKTSELFALAEKHFGKSWNYVSDEELDTVAPIPKKTTERAFYASPEPDPETLGLSYNDCLEKDLPLITVREYILLAIEYNKQTGDFLDKKGWTITSTMSSVGKVMYGSRVSDWFRLFWSHRDVRVSDVGPRSAVLNLETDCISFLSQALTEQHEADVQSFREKIQGKDADKTLVDTLYNQVLDNQESMNNQQPLLPQDIEKTYPEAYRLARKFHDRYEEYAPQFGYKTRNDTKTFDPMSPNGRTMARVCMEIVEEEVENVISQTKAHIKNLIVEEINIARSENEKTSRLTSLYNKITTL